MRSVSFLFCHSFLYIQNIQYHQLLVKLFLPYPLRASVTPSTNWTSPRISNDFRLLALSFPESSEQAHMDHPDFASPERSFATLGYPEDGWGMVKLTPIVQGMFMRAHRGVFEPCASAWGRRGATSVRLKAARKHTVRRALLAAWL